MTSALPGVTFLKVSCVEESASVAYRTLECNPQNTVQQVIDAFKEKYNYSDSVNCIYGLYVAPPNTNAGGRTAPGTASSSRIPLHSRNASGILHSRSPSGIAPSVGKSLNTPSGGHSPRQNSNTIFEETKFATEEAGSDDRNNGGPARGKWLELEKTLDYYQLHKIGAQVEFRNALTSFKVGDIDKNLSKVVRISILASVTSLMQAVAARFFISNPNEYAVQVTRGRESKWLTADKPLCAQLDTEDTYLTLRKRFLLGDGVFRSKDPHTLHFVYLECRIGVVQGIQPCKQEQALIFAALHMQITYRNYDPLEHVAGFLNLHEFLPPNYRKVMLIEEDVYKEHRKLKDMPEPDAKLRYVKLLMGFPTYGITSRPAKEKLPESGRYEHEVLVGINHETILCLHPITKAVLNRGRCSIHAFKADTGGRQLRWRQGTTLKEFEFLTEDDLEVIVTLLNGYRLLAPKSNKSNVNGLFAAGVSDIHLSNATLKLES